MLERNILRRWTIISSSSSIIIITYTLGRYIPEGFGKKMGKKLRYDTQSVGSNAGKSIVE